MIRGFNHVDLHVNKVVAVCTVTCFTWHARGAQETAHHVQVEGALASGAAVPYRSSAARTRSRSRLSFYSDWHGGTEHLPVA